MRPPRSITWLAIGVLLPQFTGCTSFKPYRGELPSSFQANDSRNPDRIRLTTQGGMKMELERVWAVDREIHGQLKSGDRAEALRVYGVPSSTWVSIPVVEVREIEKAEFNGRRTTLLVIGLAAVALTAIGVSFAQAWDNASWSFQGG